MTGAKAGCRVEVSKLVDESGSSASMFMVRQLSEREALETCWMMDMVAVGVEGGRYYSWGNGVEEGLVGLLIWRCGLCEIVSRKS